MKKINKRRLAGGLILIAGAVLILSTLGMNTYAKWKNSREVAAFEQTLLYPQPIPIDEDEHEKEASEEEKLQELQDENGVLGILSIPSISCQEAIKEGSSGKTLAEALGHMEDTVLPGETGNCVIAGHRNYNFGLYFNRLNEVEPGDEICVTTRKGTYTYEVTEIKVVEPEDLSVLEQGQDCRITLITCTPIYIATHRLIVIGTLVS